MSATNHLIIILGITCVTIIVVLLIVLAIKMQRIKQFRSALNKLKKAVDEMDEQAKLIVRTDIELNKAQEELDKKITGLYALQKLSRAISTTLEEEQIFKMIGAATILDLGFEKAAGLLWNDKEKKFLVRLNIGYSEDEIELIQSNINLNKEPYLSLINRQKTISSISLQDISFKEKIIRLFEIVSFVISPILPKEGSKGFFFAGTENIDIVINQGDEELITILANQVGQALENARLFENAWRAQQELGKKVEERTQELREALDGVKIISKRKSDFISAISHELRTPLTSIKGYASILLAEKLGKIPGEARLRLDKINRHSDELTNLINEILDISRIESGKVIMKPESQDLNNIIIEISDLFSVQLKEKHIELSSLIQKEEFIVLVDVSQIKRVFINLVSNAIKFTPAKGKIIISGHKLDGAIQIDVSDTGCGIPEEAREKIFEEFYRVDNPINEQVKGTGLGLALVKHIVEAQGGKIWVTSKPGVGSTFSFTLPLQI